MNFMQKIKQLVFNPSNKLVDDTPTTYPTSKIKTDYMISENDIPDKIENFKECHYKFLRRLNKHPVNETFSGILAKEVNAPLFTQELIDLGLITITPYSVSLSLLKNDSLKEILRHNDLNISGNKKELINRISNNIPESNVRQDLYYSDFYILTTNGLELLNNASRKSEDEDRLFFIDTVKMISEHFLDEAYQKICQHNIENCTSHGLGVDWKQCYKDGLSPNDKNRYEQLLNATFDLPIASTAIFVLMSGDSLHKIKKHFKLIFPEYSFEEISDTISVFYTTNELLDLKACSIERYSFLASLDDLTCPVCGELDGRSFLVKDAQIGVNCPPMHSGCRCTIISYYDNILKDETTRIARNPETGRPYYVPASMTWKEWKSAQKVN